MIICDDVLKWAAGYEGEPYMALLADPPYELGFMNMAFDKTGISFRPETWAALAAHLHPGAFVMAFASTRGFHRQAVAMEDAGLIMHPFCGWVTSQSFPKATRIDTQIEPEQPVVGKHPSPGSTSPRRSMGDGWQPSPDLTAPQTPLAQAWVGHRYGRQSLKNSLEPILVFQKPYEGRPVDCIVETGAGAINIEGGRISGETRDPRKADGSLGGETFHGQEYDGRPKEWDNKQGRWPSNFILQHIGGPDGCKQRGTRRVRGDKRGAGAGIIRRSTNDNVFGDTGTLSGQGSPAHGDKDGLETVADWECVEGCPVRVLAEQSGERKSGAVGPLDYKKATHGIYGEFARQSVSHYEKSEGTAARFFHQVSTRLDEADPFYYTAKASRSEREAGLANFTPRHCGRRAAKEHRNPYQRGETVRKNVHPTCKPIALTEYLATLLLPPIEYAPRRLLQPFSGSGGEMIGAWRAGWEHITGIELSEEYCAIARARLEYWRKVGVQRKLFE